MRNTRRTRRSRSRRLPVVTCAVGLLLPVLAGCTPSSSSGDASGSPTADASSTGPSSTGPSSTDASPTGTDASASDSPSPGGTSSPGSTSSVGPSGSPSGTSSPSLGGSPSAGGSAPVGPSPSASSAPGASGSSVRLVCSQEGGNNRHFLSFTVGSGAERPAVGSVPVTAWGWARSEGWLDLGDPTWAQPGTVVIGHQQLLADGITQLMVSVDGTPSQIVPVSFGEDCSFASLPS